MVFRDTQELPSIDRTASTACLDGAYRQEDAEIFRNLNRQDNVANLAKLHIYTSETSPPLSPPCTVADESADRRGEEITGSEYEGASDEDKRIATTLNNYFDQMDQSHWYTFGKDGELSKSEILEFLASDEGKNLSNQEVKDLLAASNQFDRIKGLHYFGVFALDQGSGITQGDVSYLAEGTSTFEQEYGPLWKSLKGMKAPLYTHADPIDQKI